MIALSSNLYKPRCYLQQPAEQPCKNLICSWRVQKRIRNKWPK